MLKGRQADYIPAPPISCWATNFRLKPLQFLNIVSGKENGSFPVLPQSGLHTLIGLIHEAGVSPKSLLDWGDTLFEPNKGNLLIHSRLFSHSML